MIILPAIDLYEGKVVRLKKGDYDNMTVYSDNPVSFVKEFLDAGAKIIHVVDLEGAEKGTTPNEGVIRGIISADGKIEIGGGIRSFEIIDKYLDMGVLRVILGTIAVTNRDFLDDAISKYGDKIAVSVDMHGDMVATHGWKETSNISRDEMFDHLVKIGCKTAICTDISKDGMMSGTNHDLYKYLQKKYGDKINIIASGGVTDMDDIVNLNKIGIHGAIIGKAIYDGKINVADAINSI